MGEGVQGLLYLLHPFSADILWNESLIAIGLSASARRQIRLTLVLDPALHLTKNLSLRLIPRLHVTRYELEHKKA